MAEILCIRALPFGSLVELLIFLLVKLSSSDIVFFVKAYLGTAEKCKHFCAAFKYVLPVHRNLLESGRGHSGTILEYTVILKQSQIIIIYPISFHLNRWEMATTIDHHRNILKVHCKT
jgi:hypothetical protein